MVLLLGMRNLTSIKGENWYNQGLMRELKTLREGWHEVAREERRSSEQLAIEQSLSLYLSLYRDMASQMEETEDAFRRDRESYLIELQRRLLRLNAFRQPNGNLSEPG